MFRKRNLAPPTVPITVSSPAKQITSVLGNGVVWKGQLAGTGGVRIEGVFEGEIALRGLLVVGETGRVSCEHVRANVVIVAGTVRGDITAEKLEIRSTGRVWGNVTVVAFATEEGAFLRGQITMEEKIDLGLAPLEPVAPEVPASGEPDARE